MHIILAPSFQRSQGFCLFTFVFFIPFLCFVFWCYIVFFVVFVVFSYLVFIIWIYPFDSKFLVPLITLCKEGKYICILVITPAESKAKVYKINSIQWITKPIWNQLFLKGAQFGHAMGTVWTFHLISFSTCPDSQIK